MAVQVFEKSDQVQRIVVQRDKARLRLYAQHCVFARNIASLRATLRICAQHCVFARNNAVVPTPEISQPRGVERNAYRCSIATYGCGYSGPM